LIRRLELGLPEGWPGPALRHTWTESSLRFQELPKARQQAWTRLAREGRQLALSRLRVWLGAGGPAELASESFLRNTGGPAVTGVIMQMAANQELVVPRDCWYPSLAPLMAPGSDGALSLVS